MMQSGAGALYVLDKVGDADSELRVVQTLGIPQDLLMMIGAASGNQWPRNLLSQPSHLIKRVDDATMGFIPGD